MRENIKEQRGKDWAERTIKSTTGVKEMGNGGREKLYKDKRT